MGEPDHSESERLRREELRRQAERHCEQAFTLREGETLDEWLERDRIALEEFTATQVEPPLAVDTASDSADR